MTLAKLHIALVGFLLYTSQLYFVTEAPVYLLYLAISHSDVNDVAIMFSASVIDKAIDRGEARLRTCVKAHHFEHLPQTSTDFRRDLADLTFQSHSEISEEHNIQNRSFFVVMFSQFSGSVAT